MPRRTLPSLVALAAVAAVGLAGPVAGLGPLAAPPAQAAQAVEEGEDPLEVSISSLSPAALPQRGPIRISGTVTNRDEVPWTTINLYSFISSTPMTTAEELALAAELAEDSTLGERIADPEASATIEEIAPGDTLPFSFSVPRALLPVTERGVYWFGVQALGQGAEGRDLVADGRSRTFLSSVGPRAEAVPGAMVLPVRRPLAWADDGSLDELDAWVRDLSPGGRLRSVVDFGASADSRALTWLVDPALVDAVSRLADGNPARSLAPTMVPEEVGEEPSADATVIPDPDSTDDTATPTPSGDPDNTPAPEPRDPLTVEVQALAVDWLSRLGAALPGHQVLGLPYGDLDVAGAADHRPPTYAAARARTGTSLAPYDVPIDPAVSSPSGFLDADGVALADADDTVLLTDLMFTGQPPAPPSPTDAEVDSEIDPAAADLVAQRLPVDPVAPEDVPTVTTDGVHTLVVTSSAAATGVGPGDATSPLSLRQQLLAQAAVRALTPAEPGADPRPLAVMLPSDWNPATSTGFFSGLDVSWLDLRSVAEIADTAPATTSPVEIDDLFYPRFQDRIQIGESGFEAAEDLMQVGDQLQAVLLSNDRVGGVVRDQALTSVSYTARSRPLASRLGADAAARWVQGRLDAVRVVGPGRFTMTGTAGRFSATVANDLSQPVTVTVGLRDRADPRIAVEPATRVEVPARGRTRVLLNTTVPDGGIHTVELGLVDADGTPLGTSDQLTVRALAVSNVIWLFLGTAGLLLFGAIAFRLVKRVRAARRTTRAPAAAS